MQGPGTECGLSIGFNALLLSFYANRMLFFTVSLCLCPPGQNSGISKSDVRSRAAGTKTAVNHGLVDVGVHPRRPFVQLRKRELRPCGFDAGMSVFGETIHG